MWTSFPLFPECLIVGKTYSCNCSDGYVWSNKVCETLQCCSETTCYHNLDGIIPVCVAKAEGKNLHVFLDCCSCLSQFYWRNNVSLTVHISGSVTRQIGFENLNSYETVCFILFSNSCFHAPKPTLVNEGWHLLLFSLFKAQRVL